MEYHLKLPINDELIKKLKIGDVLYVSGILFTMRDQTHKRVFEFLKKGKELPVNLKNSVIYHCGPIVKKVNSDWLIISGGPTTSMRMERFESELIKNFHIKMIIGKGGMGEGTLQALREYNCVYASFIGGAGVLAAEKIKKVKEVHWLDLGIPEALWVLEVEDFGPLIITMDSHLGNLYSKIIEKFKNKIKGQLVE
ncbi:MAG: FumA C-terminus/TtdB family hydratase beta subunit [Candidatus Odinarchaeia archaeon]